MAATVAITRLVDLTLDVRTLIESARPRNAMDHKKLRKKAAGLIRNSLDKVVDWAAKDGGYTNLKTLPNIVVEVVDTAETQEDIVKFMMNRMKALARLQREFYRTDRRVDFWTVVEPKVMGPKKRLPYRKRLQAKAGMKRGTETRPSTPDLCQDELASASPDTTATPRRPPESSSKRRKVLKRKAREADELSESHHTPGSPIVKQESRDSSPGIIKAEPIDKPFSALSVPRAASPVEYSRQPPVVYGLYVLGTSVFLLTVDSSKGEDAYISFHIDINFSDKHQSVWNALTVAIAVCSARDELMTRLDDFQTIHVLSDSDPDA